MFFLLSPLEQNALLVSLIWESHQRTSLPDGTEICAQNLVFKWKYLKSPYLLSLMMIAYTF